MSEDKLSAAHKIIRIMLRPVVRFCIKNALGIQALNELAKRVFVEVAGEELSKLAEKVNVSRLSVITGVHRKDIARLQSESRETIEPAGLIARVIGQWEQDPRYSLKQGNPRALSYGPDGSEFQALVQQISTDLNPGTVLFELERIGAVERRGDKVHLLQNVYVINSESQEGYELLANDTRDLISAVMENLTEKRERKNLHARTEYDNISPDDLPAIKEWLLKEGGAFHRKLRDFLSQYDLDLHPQPGKSGKGRVALITVSLAEEPLNGAGEEAVPRKGS